MKFLNKIKDKSDKELRKIVGDRISYLERKAKRLNPDYSFLGCDVGLNYEPHELLRSHSKYNEYGVRVAVFYNSFIGHDMKVIFGTSYREDGSMANLGMYYYADNQDYLYDFCKYVQDADIETDTEFFGYVYDFLNNYLGSIKQIDRSTLFSTIMKSDETLYTPTNVHSISKFYGNGSAMCMEYSLMAQNILRLFDFESYLMLLLMQMI